MTTVNIFSGFLGAGKTTLIKKLISEAFAGEKLILIENEFGDIGIDGGFLADSGIEITEMNSGCICCSLVGDFGKAMREVLTQFKPDRILIEPSGVGKLSDVIRAVRELEADGAVLGGAVAVADAKKCRLYLKNFGEFYQNQIENASAVVLSRTSDIDTSALETAVSLLRGINPEAVIVTTPWDELDGRLILEAMERKDTLAAAIASLSDQLGEHEHAHEHEHEHDEEHGNACACGHCHGEHEHDHEHEHDGEHNNTCACGHCHGEHEHEHEHEHDHEHGHEHAHDEEYDNACACGHCRDEHEHHHHGHDHDHDADEVFNSWGAETVRAYTVDEINSALNALTDTEKYGSVLRAKGIVASEGNAWIHFDYVPGEVSVRYGPAAVTGRICVIGAGLKEKAAAALFGL